MKNSICGTECEELDVRNSIHKHCKIQAVEINVARLFCIVNFSLGYDPKESVMATNVALHKDMHEYYMTLDMYYKIQV